MKKLKKKLDDVFSLFIRLRDSDADGIGSCVTCNRPVLFSKADNGHYLKRQKLSVRYSEINCALQCKRCNAFEQGADVKFRLALAKKYGERNILLLESLSRDTVRYSDFVYKVLIQEYQAKIRELLRLKNFELNKHYQRLLK